MSNIEELCTKAGLKMTGQRRLILKVLDQAEDHPSVEMVYERAKTQDPSISMATVYRTLNLLADLDIVVRHEFNEKFSRYELNNDQHYHMIDLETGNVIEFQNEEMEKLKEKIARELGFELVDYRLELYGRKISK